MPRSASANRASTSSHASGAPSAPCRGASSRPFTVDRMKPTGSSVYEFIYLMSHQIFEDLQPRHDFGEAKADRSIYANGLPQRRQKRAAPSTSIVAQLSQIRPSFALVASRNPNAKMPVGTAMIP